jgi:hypothetical protein
MRREQMARTPWKCPYPDCKQESSRLWNLQRHILRAHNAIGDPVKDKTSTTGQYMSAVSSKNTKLSSLHSKQVASPKHEKEKDIVDWMYERVKELKSKKDKMTEIKNLSSKSPDSTYIGQSIFPLPSIGPNASPPPSEMTGMSKQATVEFNPTVGFRTYICANCLTAPIDPVSLSDFITLGPLAFEPRHTCKQEDLENIKRRAEKKIYLDVVTTWDELRKLSIQYLADIVHQMVGLHSSIPLCAFEKTQLKPWIEKSLSINLGKIDKNHWAYRALIVKESKGTTTIDNTELMNFLNRTRATFAPFQAEIDGEVRYFYLYIPNAMY